MKRTGSGKILLVDDDSNSLKVLSAILSEEGYDVLKARSVDKAIKELNQNPPDVIITEEKIQSGLGTDLLVHLKSNEYDIPLIYLSAYGSIESAVNCMVEGAYHYFSKPPEYNSLLMVLGRAVDEVHVKKEVGKLRKGGHLEDRHLMIHGKTVMMKKIHDLISTVKNSSSNVLIIGETGTGKELIARALHFTGSRSYRPFVAVNCAAIPRDLIEAELFGHEKGAFTGAVSRRVGRIEAASGGTLFLDEIGELDIAVQSKLLRVLQEKEFSRLGDNSAIEVDFRLITSTNRDLKSEVKQGNFREDLYYRLNVVQVNLPPLRKRREDIRLLANEFLEEFCVREGKLHALSKDLLSFFESYPWPGNVRELKNLIERLVVLSKKRMIGLEHLPEDLQEVRFGVYNETEIPKLCDVEAQIIGDALLKCSGNKAKVARLLGVSRKTLYKRIESYGIPG